MRLTRLIVVTANQAVRCQTRDIFPRKRRSARSQPRGVTDMTRNCIRRDIKRNARLVSEESVYRVILEAARCFKLTALSLDQDLAIQLKCCAYRSARTEFRALCPGERSRATIFVSPVTLRDIRGEPRTTSRTVAGTMSLMAGIVLDQRPQRGAFCLRLDRYHGSVQWIPNWSSFDALLETRSKWNSALMRKPS